MKSSWEEGEWLQTRAQNSRPIFTPYRWSSSFFTHVEKSGFAFHVPTLDCFCLKKKYLAWLQRKKWLLPTGGSSKEGSSTDSMFELRRDLSSDGKKLFCCEHPRQCSLRQQRQRRQRGRQETAADRLLLHWGRLRFPAWMRWWVKRCLLGSEQRWWIWFGALQVGESPVCVVASVHISFQLCAHWC